MLWKSIVSRLDRVAVRTGSRIRLCLVGPSGSGKTARVSALARELGLDHLRLLAATGHADSFCGVRAYWAARGGEAAELVVPDWFAAARERAVLLHLDEIDKVAGDRARCTTVLDLLERHELAGGGKLHPGTVVVASGQPVERELWLANKAGVALVTRLCWVRVGGTEEYLAREYGLDVSGLTDHEEQEYELPSVSSWRGVHTVLECARQFGWDETTDEIARGCLGGRAPELKLRWQRWRASAQSDERSIWAASVPEVLVDRGRWPLDERVIRILVGNDATPEDLCVLLDEEKRNPITVSASIRVACERRYSGKLVDPARVAAGEETVLCVAQSESGMALQADGGWVLCWPSCVYRVSPSYFSRVY